MFKRILLNEKIPARSIKVDIEESRYVVSVTPTSDGAIVSVPSHQVSVQTIRTRSCAYKLREHGMSLTDAERVETIVRYLLDNWDAPAFYIVGIDGRLSADPDYYFDRWECIPAVTEDEAISKYKNSYKNWIRPEEEQLVRVHGITPEAVFVQQWIDTNIKGQK